MKFKNAILGIVGVMLALLAGAFLDFYPCVGSDLVVREIQFCALVICSVVIICTYLILKK